MRRGFAGGLIVTSILACGPVSAQWIDHPTPGMPRTADGAPDLEAPAPRSADGHPDLSGFWRLEPRADVGGLIAAAGVQPWARARRDTFMHELGRDDPGVLCLPDGPRASLVYGFAAKFVQTPGLVVILFEDLTYRQIFLDGRELPADPNPNWMGYSVGRWDGDTLVVTSAGYNDRSILDFEGHPHTEALRITERFHRTAYGAMDVEVTLEDPQAFARPVTIPLDARFVPDTGLLEYVCQENERSRQHMIGTVDDDRERQVDVPVDVLEGYAGTYRLEVLMETVEVIVSVRDGSLVVEIERGPTFPAIAVSRTRFAAQGVSIEFFPGPDGVASEFVVTMVEGDFKGVRVSDSK